MEVAVAALAAIAVICTRSVCFKEPQTQVTINTRRLEAAVGEYLEQIVLDEKALKQILQKQIVQKKGTLTF
jgi:hypothetical protein